MRCSMLFGQTTALNRVNTRGVERIIRATRTPFDRLRDYPAVFRFRAGHRVCSEKVHEDEHGLFSFRTVDPRVDCRLGVSFGKPGGAGSDRDGRERGEIRNFDFALLLDRGGSGDGVCRDFYDAVLLRVAGALRAGIPKASL